MIGLDSYLTTPPEESWDPYGHCRDCAAPYREDGSAYHDRDCLYHDEWEEDEE